MATGGWRQATQETVISAAVILASDVFLQHLDGRLNIATDKAAVKKALHWAASRPGRLVTSAVNKAGSGSPMGIPQSLTLENEVRSLLKAHALSSAGKMPKFPGMHDIHKTGHTFDIVLGNAEKVTVRLSLPQTSQANPTSFWTYIQDAINSMKILVCDRMMSMYTVLSEMGEYGFCMLSQRVINAGWVEQVLMGSTMVIGVVVGGTYLVRAIRQLHETRLIADGNQENKSGNEQDWQNATGDESGVGGIDEKVVGEDEQGQSPLELKYMEALRCLMEKSSAIEALESKAEQVAQESEQAQSLIELKYTEALRCLMEKSSAVEALKSETNQQKELLVTKDRQLGGLKLTHGMLDAKEDTTRTLKAEASAAEKLLSDRDQEIMRLDKVNTALESTADQQRKAITSLTTRAEERTNTMKNLTKTLAEAQTETKQLRMEIANLRSDNNLMRSKNEADATKPLKLIAELETSNKELRKQIISLTEDNQDLQTQMNDDIVAFDSKLDDVVQLTTDTETLKAEIERLLKINEQFTELDTTNGELLSEITSLIRDNEVLQTQVDDVDKKLDDVDQLRTDKETLRAEIERLQKINERLTKAKDDSVASAVDSQKIIDTLRSDNQKLEGQTDALETKNKHLQKTLANAEENIKTLQDNILALKEEVAESKEERQGLLEKCDEGDAEVKAKDNKLQQLTNALRDNGKLSSEKDGTISELKKAYNHMKSTREDSDAVNRDFEEEVDDLNEALDSAQAKFNNTQSELEQANIELNRVRADLEASRKEKKALRAQLKGDGQGPKSDDEEEGEKHKEGHEVDEDKGDRDEAHEKEDEEESDEEDENAHDNLGPDNGSNEASRGEDDNNRGEDYEGGGDDDGEDDDQGDDAPDGGAGKTGHGGDNKQVTEQSATATTAPKAPQQPLRIDGLSDTIRSLSVYSLQAGPANGQSGDDNQVTEQSATPTTTHGAPQKPLRADGLSDTIRSPSVHPPQAGPAIYGMPETLQEALQQPLKADGLSDTIRSPSGHPLQAGPEHNGMPESPPAVAAPSFPLSQQPQVPHPGPIPFTSGPPAKEGRVILAIRRRKNASDYDVSQKNPFAGMTLPDISPKLEPDVDILTTRSPAQTSSAQDPAPENPKQALNDDTVTSVSPSHTIYPAPGIPLVEPKAPTLPSPTQDPATAPATSTPHPSHNSSTAEDKAAPQKFEEEAKQQRLGSDKLIEPDRSSPTPNATQHGNATDNLISPVQASPTPSAPEGHLAGTGAEHGDGPISDLIDPIQSSPISPASEEHAAAADSPSHGSPANGSNKPIQSPTTRSTAAQQAPRTYSGNQVAPADESIDPIQSSPVSSASGEQASATDAAIQSSPTPSTAMVEQAAGNESELQGASTDELIDPIQSSPFTSVSGVQATTADAAIQSSPTNESNEFTHSSPTPSTAVVEQAAGTESGHQDASTDESIGHSHSSSKTPLDSYNGPPSKTPDTPAQAPPYDIPSPFHDSTRESARPRSQSISTPSPTRPSTPSTTSHQLDNTVAPLIPQHGDAIRPFPRSTSCPPSTRSPGFSSSSNRAGHGMRIELEHLNAADEGEDGFPISLDELSAFIYTKSKALQPSKPSPPSNIPTPTPSISPLKTPMHESPFSLSDTIAPPLPPSPIQTRDETTLFPPTAPPLFTPWPAALPPFLTSLAKYAAEDPSVYDREDMDTSGVHEAQVKKHRRRKPRPKASHFEPGGWKLRNVFAQSRGVFDDEGDRRMVCKLPPSSADGGK